MDWSKQHHWINHLPFGAGLFLLFALFTCFKSFGFHLYAGDEHIYMAQGDLLAQGVLPYRDFVAAHPPLQMGVAAIVLNLFGYSAHLSHLLALFFTLAGAVALALLVYREMGALAALLSPLTFLFSYEVLRASTHFTGVNMTVALLFWALLFQRRQMVVASAGFCIAALFTRLYAAPFILVLLIAQLLSDRHRFWRMALWAASFFTLGVIVSGLIFGFSSMWENLLAFHLSKTPMNPQTLASQHFGVLFHNAMPLALTTISALDMGQCLITGASRKNPEKHGIYQSIQKQIVNEQLALPLIGLGVASLIAFILWQMDRVWMYYYIPLLAGAALATTRLYTRLTRALFPGPPGPSSPIGRLLQATPLLISVGLALIAAPRFEEQLPYFQKAMMQPEPARHHAYQFDPAPLPDSVNRLIEQTIFVPDRVIGQRYLSLTYLLWHEGRHLSVIENMVDDISQHAKPSDTIFGDSGTAPLVALLTGHRLAHHLVDTNIQHYRQSPEAITKTMALLNAKPPSFILLRTQGRRGFGVAGVPAIWEFTLKNYRLLKQYNDPTNKTFLLFAKDPL